MRLVIFEGREQALAPLCKRFRIHLRTVVSRLERGQSVSEALQTPVRSYPAHTTRKKPKPPQMASDELREDAIDLMLDMREILVSLEPTPRRERILAGVRRWLRVAGWR
jgi:hypothetical protein